MEYFRTTVNVLNRSDARYVIVGGLATVLHGYPRFTADIDLVLDLHPEAALKTIRTLVLAGFVPLAPVDPEQFADASCRQMWQKEKGMMVFSMWQKGSPPRAIDLFLEAPLPFEDLYSRSVLVDLGGETFARIAGIEDLIGMKEKAGRPRDLDDIARLRELGK